MLIDLMKVTMKTAKTSMGLPAEMWATWRSDPRWAPPGGEALVDLGARVREACVELVEEAQDRDVVVVSHVSPIKAAVGRLRTAWTGR